MAYQFSEIFRLLAGTVILRPYVFAFLIAYLVAAVFFLGPKRTLLFTMLAYLIAFVSEYSSTRNGFPYGFYYYIDTTRTRELWISNVPFMDSLSYTFLSFISYNVAILIKAPIFKSRRDCQIVDTFKIRQGIDVAFLGAFLFTMLDVIIDPVTLQGSRWFLGQIYGYPEKGAHFGVPISNYLGWFLVGFVTLFLYQKIDLLLRRKKWLCEPKLPRYIPYITFLGLFIYLGVLAFNLGMTFYIGEIEMGVCGLFTACPYVIIASLCGIFWKQSATREDFDRHFKDFSNSFLRAPRIKKPIVLLFALGAEKNVVERHLKGYSYTSKVVGVGPEPAYRTTARILEEERRAGQTSFYLLLGVCGGCHPSLTVGTVIAPSHAILRNEGINIPLTTHSMVKEALHAPLLTDQKAACRPDEKEALLRTYGAWGCDMESAAIAKAFQEAGRLGDLLIIRSVVDSLKDDISFIVRVLNRRAKARDYLVPRNFFSLLSSALHFHKACRSLARAAATQL